MLQRAPARRCRKTFGIRIPNCAPPAGCPPLHEKRCLAHLEPNGAHRVAHRPRPKSSLAHRVTCHTVRRFFLGMLMGAAPRAAQG